MPTNTFMSLSPAKQERIVSSILEEFACYGYSVASTNRICSRAGISKGSMFQYFENKEDIFIYVVKRSLKEIIAIYREKNLSIKDSMDLKEVFVRSCFLMLEFYEKYPFHYRLYLRINYEVDFPDFKKIRRYLNKYVSAVTHRFIEVGIKKGVLKKDIDADLALFMVNNMLFRLVEVFFIPGVDPVLNLENHSGGDRKVVLEKVYQLIIGGMGS